VRPYLYLSDAKVEQHFQQIPQEFLSTAKAEKFRLKLGFAEADFADTTRPPNRFSKLAAVMSRLSAEGRVGTLRTPKLYFQGSIEMKYGVFPKTEMIYFSGRTSDAIVGLVGSLRHAEAARDLQTLTRSGWGSSAAGMRPGLADALDLQPALDQYERDAREDVGGDLAFLVGQAERLVKGPTAHVEFTAIRLAEGLFEGKVRTLLGTPFYVAYAA